MPNHLFQRFQTRFVLGVWQPIIRHWYFYIIDQGWPHLVVLRAALKDLKFLRATSEKNLLSKTIVKKGHPVNCTFCSLNAQNLVESIYDFF